MALVTTFATTPLTAWLYPPWYQKKLDAWKRGEIDWDGNRLVPGDDASDRDATSIEKLQNSQLRRLLVHLRLDSLSGLVTFVGLLGGKNADDAVHKVHPLKANAAAAKSSEDHEAGAGNGDEPVVVRKRPVEVHGLRMVELTERTSSVMKVSELVDFRDPVVDVFHTFANLNNVAVSGEVVIMPPNSYADTLARKASDMSSDLLLLPWGENGEISEGSDALAPSSQEARFAHGSYHHFVSKILAEASCNTAVFVNNGFGGQGKVDARAALKRSVSAMSLRSTREIPTAPVTDRSHHIFLPYFGGADDRVALRFVLQLAENVNVTATILLVERVVGGTGTSLTEPKPALVPSRQSEKNQPSSLEAPEEEDDEERVFFNSIKDSLPRALEVRVMFDSISTEQPLRDAFERAKAEVGQNPKNAGDLVVVGRRKGVQPSLRDEMIGLLAALGRPNGTSSDGRPTLGEMAEALVVGNVKASVLVIQAGNGHVAA